MRRAEAGIQVDKFYPPTDWLDNNNKQIDIRKNAENNSIVLLVGHSANFSKYSLLGFVVNTSAGTYDVYIDDVLVGSGITKNTQYDIDFSTINTSYGSATTPEALVLHKIVIKPTTSGEKITSYTCARTVGASGTQSQGILWAHFELSNVISIRTAFGYAGVYSSPLFAITSKGDFIDNGNYSVFSMCAYVSQLRYVCKIYNILDANSSFRGTSNIKRLRFDKVSLTATYMFENNNKLEQIQTKEAPKGASATAFLYNAYKLKLFPTKNNVATNLTNFLTNAQSLYPTKVDFSDKTGITKIDMYGSSTYPMRGLRGLKVSNEAPFTGTSPQINVSYTGLDRDALRELFTSLPYNVGYEVVGSPTINNGVVSGFSSNDYLQINHGIDFSKDVEIVLKVHTDTIRTTQYLMTWVSSGYIDSGLSVGFFNSTNERYAINIYKDSLTNEFIVSSSPNVQNDTDVWFKFLWDSTNKVVKYGESYDGVNYRFGINKTITEKFLDVTKIIIGNFNTTYPFNGSIDLNNSYIKLDNVYLFRGQAQTTKTLSLVGATGNNLTKVGSPTIDENGVASNFSNSNYVSVNKSGFDVTKDYEFIVKFVNSTSKYHSVILGGTSSAFSLKIEISYGTRLFIFLSSNGTSWNIANGAYGLTGAMSLGNTYYLKFVYLAKSGYRIYLSTNAKDWVLQWFINVINPIYMTNNNFALGVSLFDNNSLGGSIDLNNSLIKQNNNIFMKGYLSDTDKNIALNKGWQLTLS